MSGKMQSIVLAGLVTGVLALLISIPQNPILQCVGCLVYMGAGLMGVWHFTSTNGVTISGGQGVGIGAAAGAIAAILASLLGMVLFADRMTEGFSQALEGLAQNPDIDDETYDTLEGFFTGSGIYVFVVFFGALIGSIMGLIGGAIGASVFKNGEEAV